MEKGDIVQVKPGMPGYDLWCKGKRGIIARIAYNEWNELRYMVDFGDETLPFGEWEIQVISKEGSK